MVECVRLLEVLSPHVITLACTSACYVGGVNGDHALLKNLAKATNAEISSTSTASLAGCHALNIRSVSVASIYTTELTDKFIDFLAQGNIRTIHQQSKEWEILPPQNNQLTENQVVEFILENVHPDADAIRLPERDRITAPKDKRKRR